MPIAHIVLFGDTHLGFDLPCRPRVERRARGEDFFANYQRVVDYALATRPAAVLHGGDVFHRSRVHHSVVERAFEALAEVAAAGIPVLIVPGNHDRSRLPPSLWLGHQNIHVFDRPRTVVIETSGGRLAFGGFPFAWGDLRASFADIVERSGVMSVDAGACFLCMHHTVAGASVGPIGYTFRAGRDVIPRAALPPSLTAVLSGHIHRHQVLTGNHPPVFYPGSIERTSFAERDEPKGFLDLTVTTSADRAAVTGAQFVELPARTMIDLPVPPEVERSDVGAFLTRSAAALPPDAVIRIDAGARSAELGEALGAAQLRAALPPTMSVQWHRGRFRAD